MKKILLSALVFVLCLCVLPVGVFASESDGEVNLTSDIETTAEYTSLISIEDDLLRQMQVLSETKERNSLPSAVDFTKAVKVSALDNLDSVDVIAVADNTDSYYYRIPLAVDTGYIYSTIVVTGGEVTGYDTSITYDTSLGQVSYLFDEKLVGNLLATFPSKVTDIAVYTIPAIKTDFVCFVSNDARYAIPFSSRPDFLKLNNGEIYKYDEFISCAKALLNEMQDDSVYADNRGGAGGGYTNSLTENTLYNIIAPIMLIVALAMLAVFYVKRQHRDEKR